MGQSPVGVVGRLWPACVWGDLYLSGDRKQSRQEMKYDLNSLIPFLPLLTYPASSLTPIPLPVRSIPSLGFIGRLKMMSENMAINQQNIEINSPAVTVFDHKVHFGHWITEYPNYGAYHYIC